MIDAVDDAGGGDGDMGVVVMATDGLDVLGLSVDESLDETALAGWTAVLEKRIKRRWTLLLMLLMAVDGQDAPR